MSLVSYFSDKTEEVTLTVVQTLHITLKGLETVGISHRFREFNTGSLDPTRQRKFFKSHSVHADVFQKDVLKHHHPTRVPSEPVKDMTSYLLALPPAFWNRRLLNHKMT